MTVLAIINIKIADDKFQSKANYIQSILYFERIIQQTIHEKNYREAARNMEPKHTKRMLELVWRQ